CNAANCILFHLASDCTTTALESFWFFIGKRTGLSVPLRSSLMPVPSSTTKGQVNLNKLSFLDKLSEKVVLIKSIALSVSLLFKILWYFNALTPTIIEY